MSRADELQKVQRRLHELDLELWGLAWEQSRRLRRLGIDAATPMLPRPSQYGARQATPAATRSGTLHRRPGLGRVTAVR